MTTQRLTQEQALKADLFGVQCPSVLTTEAERLLSGRIADLLELLRAATARIEHEQKRYEDCLSALQDTAKEACKAEQTVTELRAVLGNMTARAEQAEKRAPNWYHLSAISNFTQDCECAICTGEMLLEAVEKHSLLLGKQQAEKDRDALAAEVRAWRAFDAACGVRDRIAYTAALRPVHPIDTMKATDASGALQRAKGGA